jgi:lipopolysaccharide transport system permease protein
LPFSGGLAILFYQGGRRIHPKGFVALTRILMLITGLLYPGTGMIVSAFTTKYRDLSLLPDFRVPLLMYATPVIYSLPACPISNNESLWPIL